MSDLSAPAFVASLGLGNGRALVCSLRGRCLEMRVSDVVITVAADRITDLIAVLSRAACEATWLAAHRVHCAAAHYVPPEGTASEGHR